MGEGQADTGPAFQGLKVWIGKPERRVRWKWLVAGAMGTAGRKEWRPFLMQMS